MKRFRNHAGRIAAVATVAAFSAALVAASASGTTIIAGDLIVKVDGSFSPKTLSKTTFTPITLKANGSIATNDGTHVPALKTLDFQFDKNGTIYTKGLPTCKYGSITNTLTADAKKACGPALVGQGKVTAELEFPDSKPVQVPGTMLVFNGAPQGGRPVLLFHAYVTSPISATVVAKAVIAKGHGKYGTSTSIGVPPLAGGYASLTSFTTKIGKSWNYKGQKKNLILAKCPTGNLFAHGDFTFVNGTQMHGDVAVPCKGK